MLPLKNLNKKTETENKGRNKLCKNKTKQNKTKMKYLLNKKGAKQCDSTKQNSRKTTITKTCIQKKNK